MGHNEVSGLQKCAESTSIHVVMSCTYITPFQPLRTESRTKFRGRAQVLDPCPGPWRGKVWVGSRGSTPTRPTLIVS
eukprot:1347828-Amorphochlora_amoeboformis.AAC.1